MTRGFIKACIWNSREGGKKKKTNAVKVKTNKTGDASLSEYYKVADMLRGVSDHLAEKIPQVKAQV